jgi:pimeloyl-ACP methyl ester carboxylesterase
VAVDRIPCDDGASIALHHFGGRGPTVLVVHAASLCGSMYRPLAKALGDEFSVVALDLRGHGNSTASDGNRWSWRRLGHDVAGVIDHLGTPIFGFGHSLGATALLLAAASRPGHVAAVVAYEPVLLATPLAIELAEIQAVRAARRHASFESLDAARARLGTRPPLDRVDPDSLEAYLADGFFHLADGSIELVLAPENEAALYRAGIDLDLDRDLAGLEARVSVVTGEESEHGLDLGAEHLASMLDLVDLWSLRGGGHFGPLEDPAATAALIHRAFETPAA